MTRSLTILLVEDNDVDVEVVKRGFRQQRIANEIRVARDGLAALELLRNDDNPFPRPYLILLDLNMPRMNGIEFLQALRADPSLRNSIVFVLTTSSDEQDKIDAYDLNVAGYFLKDSVGDEFMKLVTLLGLYWRVVEAPPDVSR